MPPSRPSDHSIIENQADGQFELRHADELVSYARFREEQRGDQTIVVVPHVETIPIHRGNGHAAQLMDGILEKLRNDGRRILPQCSFAAAHVRSSDQHHELIASP